MADLKDKVMVITGGSRGIGLAIAKRAAQDGAKIAILAKTTEPHPRLPGTIYTAVEEIEQLGGEGLPIPTDIRDEDAVAAAVKQTADKWGGIDICVNNASAINLTGTLHTPMKKFDLMFQVNVRGTYVTSQACLPYLLEAENPHILNLSPPLNMDEKWFKPHVAYTMAKYGMSMCVLGMAAEFRDRGVAVNALWPRTGISTAAITLIGGMDAHKRCRKPEIMSDAAHWILTQPSRECSGNYFIDDDVLQKAGVTDLDQYAIDPNTPLMPDFFVEQDQPSMMAAKA